MACEWMCERVGQRPISPDLGSTALLLAQVFSQCLVTFKYVRVANFSAITVHGEGVSDATPSAYHP